MEQYIPFSIFSINSVEFYKSYDKTSSAQHHKRSMIWFMVIWIPWQKLILINSINQLIEIEPFQTVVQLILFLSL